MKIDDLLKSIKVLYVEDDDFTREEIEDFLSFEVGEVITAKNGEEGLDKFKEYNPDIVITDINMPKMNGLEMSKEIKKLSPTTPIIITSAYSDSDYVIKAIEIGISRYVLKPIDFDELLSMIIQSAKELMFDKTIDVQNEYIKFLLDSNPSFMLILTNKEMEHINKNFLEFLGYESEEEFIKEHKTLDNLIEPSIDELLNNIINKKKSQYVMIRKGDKKEEFVVNYKFFEKLQKHIFVFSKLSKEEIYYQLLNSLKEECSDEIKNRIEKVLNG